MNVDKETKYIRKHEKKFKKSFLKHFFGQTDIDEIFLSTDWVLISIDHEEGSGDGFKIPIEEYKKWKSDKSFKSDSYELVGNLY